MRKIYMIYPIIVVMVVLAGCVVAPTGEAVLTPEAIETIDAVAVAAEPAGQLAVALSMFWPPAAILGGILAGAAGAWKKMKPELITAQNHADLGMKAGEATASAIEEFKKQHPDEWSMFSDYLNSYHGVTVENFYRALRGLPQKE
jgi:hypothetical protein